LAIPFITELHVSVGAEDELAAHGLDVESALEVEWNGPEFFRDKLDGRYRMIGKDDGGALLTIIIEPSNEHGRWDVVTGWKSSKGERTVWQKCQP
jgi:uncharacterized DUF497 family protein